MKEITLKTQLKKEMNIQMQRTQEEEGSFFTCPLLASIAKTLDLNSRILDDYKDFLKNSLYFKSMSCFNLIDLIEVHYHDEQYLEKRDMFFEFLESPHFNESQY